LPNVRSPNTEKQSVRVIYSAAPVCSEVSFTSFTTVHRGTGIVILQNEVCFASNGE